MGYAKLQISKCKFGRKMRAKSAETDDDLATERLGEAKAKGKYQNIWVQSTMHWIGGEKRKVKGHKTKQLSQFFILQSSNTNKQKNK